jgi:hypothetical protein
VTSRLGGASQVRPNVHSHGTWGTAGAAVAVAKLRDHDTAVLRTVINLATSMSPANSWRPCFEGATIRNLYPGRSNLQGILATHLLACGYTAVHDAPSDLYGTILGERFDREAVVEGVSAEDRVSVYRIERNYFKFHACCLYNHPVLDAVHALVQDDGLGGTRHPAHPRHLAAVRDAHGGPVARQHAGGQVLGPVRGGGRGWSRAPPTSRHSGTRCAKTRRCASWPPGSRSRGMTPCRCGAVPTRRRPGSRSSSATGGS